MSNRAELTEVLKLANNGYTYEHSIPVHLRATLAEMVGEGTVVSKGKRHPCRRTLTTTVYILASDADEVLTSMAAPY